MLLPPTTVEIFADSPEAPSVTEEAPVRERTSMPETFEKALFRVTAEVMARVSVPVPPAMELFPSRAELAIEMLSLPEPPIRVRLLVNVAV